MNSYFSPAQFLLGHFATARETELVAREEVVRERVKGYEQREHVLKEREEELAIWSENLNNIEIAVEQAKGERKSINDIDTLVPETSVGLS